MKLKIFPVITLIILSLWGSHAHSVAFCALRDPVQNIYKLFPNATSYRSIVHEVNQSSQQHVKNSVPFSIHKDELGQHTLYVAMQENKALGFVHSRSEVGLWGLIEIVWAFDLHLNVVNFNFQRCRESSCDLIQSSDFVQLLKGKSVNELKSMIEKEDYTLPDELANNEDARTLAKTLMRSAIKTALVTEHSWRDEIQSLLQNNQQ